MRKNGKIPTFGLMKFVISNGSKLMFAASLVFALAAGATAQPENFHVGETVETPK